MKKVICLIGVLIIYWVGAANADTWEIDDLYIGGTNGGDVISTDAQFNNYNIDNMTVNIDEAGKVLVTINTGYSTLFNGDDTFNGTDYGDLFISIDGWNPYGDPNNNYKADNYSNGTSWEYVFDTSANNIYEISQNKILLSDDSTFTNPSNWVGDLNGSNVSGELYNGSNTNSGPHSGRYYWYRHGQEVWYNNDGATATDTEGGSLFSDEHSGIGGYLTYEFDLSSLGITPEQGYNLGLHWAMTCGNDVIEGGLLKSATVPEPGTLLLFSFGLLGLSALGRKKSNPFIIVKSKELG